MSFLKQIRNCFIRSVHEEASIVTTILKKTLIIENVKTVISKQLITCSNEFAVQIDADVFESVSLSRQLSADLATFKLLDIGRFIATPANDTMKISFNIYYRGV